MPQAIITKYLPQTNYKPARIKAQGSAPRAPSIIVSYHTDNCPGGYAAHKRAAAALASKLKWDGKWCGQEMGASWVFVCDPMESFTVRHNV